MKFLWLSLLVIPLAGCVGTHPKGTTRVDHYDAVIIDQMVGNNVSKAVFAKTVVCLNARREIRRVSALTNLVVVAMTNQTINLVTNQTISTSSNFLFTLNTNLAPASLGALPAPATPTGESAAGAATTETNVAVLVTNAAPPATFATNLTLSVANNASATAAPNQRTANNQLVRTINNQLTTTSNNLSVSVLTNVVSSAETNQVVTYVTNTAVVAVTNYMITPTNGLAYDYFLYTELIPPSDFILAQGESLLLLVDGVRYGFSPSPSSTAFVGRRGYNSTLYRVPPEVFVAIANSKEVHIRFKGVSSVVERKMNSSSRQHFRDYLAKYFAPAAPPVPPRKVAAAD